ncbi:MAG: GNAT family N-acetyltransferase, partial [Phaeovulum sp.]|uniref:GNAT family N-acetyltransferase n=1 Tax=Phaeovulum sp. TaxID=2934796 RepID=UPI002733BFB7
MTLARYTFRAATMQDLSLLRVWKGLPHVRAWWGEGEPFSEQDLHDPHVSRWIVEHDFKPFAYMQDYSVHGWEGHHFEGLP